MTLFVVAPSKNRLQELFEKIKVARTRSLTVQNLASVVSLVIWRKKSDGMVRTCLFTGDAHEDEICTGLDALMNVHPGLKNLEDKGMLCVDYMDIPHHGSSNNSTEKLYKRVRARYYGYSYNGTSHATTMCNGDVLNHIIRAHNDAQEPCQILLTFPDKAWKNPFKLEDSDFVELSYLPVDYSCWTIDLE